MYEWRKMTNQRREQILASRQKNLRPWHRPPHFETEEETCFHISAACYEHQSIIGISPERMTTFELQLTGLLSREGRALYAWCVLPNHWHAMVRVTELKGLIKDVGRFHGRTSYHWNREDSCRGRKCWHGCADRRIRSDRHFYVARNYIHHNPVRHGYVAKWDEWVYSSAGRYIAEKGRDEIRKEWKMYPILDMGEGWDD